MHSASVEQLSTASDGGVLMDCMETICAIHHIPFSRLSVLTGLPLNGGDLSPTAMTRAASKIGLQCRSAKRRLTHINPALLPAILVLDNKQACVLLSVDDEAEQAEVVFPELNQSAETITLESLEQQ